MRWPSASGRVALATALWIAAGTALTRQMDWPWLVLPAGVAILLSRRSPFLFLVAFGLGVGCGHLATVREQNRVAAEPPEGYDQVEVVALGDSGPGRYGGFWVMARPLAVFEDELRQTWPGPDLLLELPPDAELFEGERYRITGTLLGSRVEVEEVASGEGATSTPDPFTRVGHSLRHLVLDRLDREEAAEALLAGFLVGDTSGLAPADVEALRAAGLSHFVAVSGSNVAGFLLLLWIGLGPLGVGPRRRGVLGLIGLFVFAVATRWEPSVIRAGLMAGTVLGARMFGLVVETWAALSLGVGLAILVAPDLVTDLGFQLSVAATAGILLGADALPPSLPTWLRQPLGVGLSAQIAVAPILLVTFGELPLFAPLTNVLAAPLVTAATLAAALGVVASVFPLVDLAAFLADGVLWLGRRASWLPQISAFPSLALGASILLLVKLPRSRPAISGALTMGIVLVLIKGGLGGPAVAFLDVGQGDAALLVSGRGRVVLIDAGPDPRVLWRGLRRHRIRALDLVVATHPHDDHIAGLLGLAGRIPIGSVWFAGTHHPSKTWDEIDTELRSQGVPVQIPPPGTNAILDDLTLTVLGPERRYENPNDESIVILVQGPRVSVLMTGDVEVSAQTDVEAVDIDVLKVPHHGAMTSRIEWLLATTPKLAVVSVGENDFGHPRVELIDSLEASGVVVRRTDHDSDVILSLASPP